MNDDDSTACSPLGSSQGTSTVSSTNGRVPVIDTRERTVVEGRVA